MIGQALFVKCDITKEDEVQVESTDPQKKRNTTITKTCLFKYIKNCITKK